MRFFHVLLRRESDLVLVTNVYAAEDLDLGRREQVAVELATDKFPPLTEECKPWRVTDCADMTDEQILQDLAFRPMRVLKLRMSQVAA